MEFPNAENEKQIVIQLSFHDSYNLKVLFDEGLYFMVFMRICIIRIPCNQLQNQNSYVASTMDRPPKPEST